MIIEGAALRGLDGGVGRALAGHHDHRQRRPDFFDVGQGVEAVHAGQANVQNHQIELGDLQLPHGFFGRHEWRQLRGRGGEGFPRTRAGRWARRQL